MGTFQPELIAEKDKKAKGKKSAKENAGA